ncbi:hypothetical protein EJ02DRAFT_369299 [Clathrospora elynae]|uniref:DUF3074 domain-containing protein n=1 Tax=Clathrospora elynae TaxID=706981 RepID=A0A6A5SYD6_9PLEO|nr:hypothetical protein EJ02DRAFT_369299 [Clathrospora elynae]
MAGTGGQRPEGREYLSLNRLNKLELPPHPDFPNESIGHTTSLVQFLNDVFTEVQQFNFDQGTQSRGRWPLVETNITMPLLPKDYDLPESESHDVTLKHVTKPVPVNAVRLVKVMSGANWLGRVSYHHEALVKLSELERLLFQDHSLNEAMYTPGVYDANDLLIWDPADLQQAVSKLEPQHNIRGVEMAVYQMFHRMPKIMTKVLGGFSPLQDRVFHVLVITIHTVFKTDEIDGLIQSYTVQIPVDFESFSNCPSVAARSHTKKSGSTLRYHFPVDAKGPRPQRDPIQERRHEKRITEGKYVSLERVREAHMRQPLNGNASLPVVFDDNSYSHRWDMMTLTDAGGITRFVSEKTKEEKTLIAIANDVKYVIQEIAKQRQE